MTDLFRGYVPTKNKKCLIKFRNVDPSQLKTYDEVKDFNEYAGILSRSTILIDIDNFEQSEILMNMVEELQLRCRVYETTRGKHFLFKNINLQTGDIIQPTCKTGTNLVCGLTSDIKVGCKNSYSILKFKGKDRKIIYDIFEDEEYEEVPKWLLPIKHDTNFLTMEAGDGRNQALFNYILTLQSNGFGIEEVRDTIRLINQYVLKDPLDETELETILRDDAFKKEVFFQKSKFLFDKFAMFIKNNCNIIKLDGQLCIYKDGIYVNDTKLIKTEMIKRIPGLSRTQREEALSYLDLLIDQNSKPSGEEYIAFKNGIYNIVTGEFFGFAPEYILTNKIDYDYIPDAYSYIADTTLDKLSCHDDRVRDLLEEVIGYTFYRRNELRKAFILIGDKANGKSTYLDMIKTLLGDDNTCAIDLGELGDRFKTAELFHKLANIGDDIGDDFIANPAVFKKLVSGDRLNAERKGQDPFDFNSYAKLLFSANNIPRIKDKSGAVLSRLIIIPFTATFSKNDPDYDPYIKYKLRSNEAMQYLIQVGLDGLKRVLENQGFTISMRVQKEIDEYEINNNPILLFLKDTSIKVLNEPTSAVYKKYTEFCIANSFSPMSNIEFSKVVRKKFDLDITNKTISGKKYRIFVKGGSEDEDNT